MKQYESYIQNDNNNNNNNNIIIIIKGKKINEEGAERGRKGENIYIYIYFPSLCFFLKFMKIGL